MRWKVKNRYARLVYFVINIYISRAVSISEMRVCIGLQKWSIITWLNIAVMRHTTGTLLHHTTPQTLLLITSHKVPRHNTK